MLYIVKRKEFLRLSGSGLTGLLCFGSSAPVSAPAAPALYRSKGNKGHSKGETVTLFLSGDVMTGRGIDQVLPHSVDPELRESYIKDAGKYVSLAEKKNGHIPSAASYEYIWGDALEVLSKFKPDFRIINLETAVTDHSEFWKGKGINYRMHPANVGLLTQADIDLCLLANNHILDFSFRGLQQTLQTLHEKNIFTAGAGSNLEEASRPAIFPLHSGRLLVFSYASASAGVPGSWKATTDKPGVNYLESLSSKAAERVIQTVNSFRSAGDLVMVSIHWGSNWGYAIPPEQREFAHHLVEEGPVDLIHGHSSHHPKGIEVHNERLIIYGAGDLINDYEGIQGHEEFRDDLSLMYFPKLDASGKLIGLSMQPMHIRRFSLGYATKEETVWLGDMLNRECGKFDISIIHEPDGSFSLSRN